MTIAGLTSRSSQYRPRVAWFVMGAGLWVFCLVLLGAFTTSIGAGMIFADWPLSNGSLNPEGWLENIAMFAEHSHRLSAGLMSCLTIGIAIVLTRSDARPWVRRLAWFAVAMVFAQALVGGLRVLLDHLQVEMVDTSVGRLFAMLHAVLAQLFVCTLLALALSQTRGWFSTPPEMPASLRKWALLSTGLLILQLAVAAIMRHSYAGMAISTFPQSTPDGDWLPATWNFRVSIHFAHRVMALILTGVLLVYAGQIFQKLRGGWRIAAAAISALLGAQICLGAAAIWTYRNPYVTTGHVIVGAVLLATVFGTTWWLHRARLIDRETNPQ